ncbi:MAG TPA: 4Fe-4S ferredoxin [Verrucomicrobiota bacterium]|nr:4Fe-4S ferredoxin [Verrucomicrobiota bacterium]HOF69701.1 4Fe-4S ferredoxin [Verrucomicrobiota bacterium]HPW91393.1 4Fe-4S ferredoxin [Verrucomicrobiota bacterium]HQB72110.1 4Fe-4S ferredoxin [Verrucomicrobiota bacterium]
MTSELAQPASPVGRQRMDADIVCVGFGPATAGFLTTLSRQLLNPDGTPAVESRVLPGAPPQVLCYERADDLSFGVSGVVTRARGLRASLPQLNPREIPMAAPVTEERVVYLLDPLGVSRRSGPLRAADACLRAFRGLLPVRHEAFELPWAPAFLHKTGGLVLSMGQFLQWIGAQVQSSGTVQVWPGTPVAEALIAGQKVEGVRLLDQGVDKQGRPGDGFMPGMDIHAALTVVGDGPVGPVGLQLDARFGLPAGHHIRDWAVGMKFVVDLPADTPLQPGAVLHTFGFPEPEIFGFFYVHPDRVASLGIFVPSWFDSPARTAYRYLQHWMLHPYLWRYLKGGKLRSWGAKTLGESGRRGEPHLVGDGYARIGEGSGTTNVLTGSGLDEAWVSGVQLAEGVLELLKAGKPFTRQNLEAAYVRRRRASWVEAEARIAGKARDGFQKGVLRGMIGMALAGLTCGRLNLGGEPLRPYQRIPSLEEYYRGRIPAAEIQRLRKECATQGTSLHHALMERCGWPAIPYDGQLLVSHQDALLLGGKVQAPPGYADHVLFLYPELCERCGTRICIEMCSGQAIAPGAGGVPSFDREKCVHCGACYWNCAHPIPGDPERMNIAFRAGPGGLHSAEN